MKLDKASEHSMYLMSSTELIQELGVVSPVYKAFDFKLFYNTIP